MYKPGKELLIADALSRNHLQDEFEEEEDFSVNVVAALPITTSKLEELQRETNNDTDLHNLAIVVKTGWPNNRSEVPPLLEHTGHSGKNYPCTMAYCTEGKE